MRKIRGFKLGKRIFRVTRWVLRKTRIRPGYNRMCGRGPTRYPKAISKLITWGRRLTDGAKAKLLCCTKPGRGYVQLDHDPTRNDIYAEKSKTSSVPKGHLAVYVGQKDGDFHRVLVPVIYFNHPLFGELLRESEEEFGFQHQGGITIPCRYSEFEQVQTRIAAGSGGRKLARRHQYHF
uniref:Small auxin up regulated protein n=1 Tax=Boehmeria nivea TaxID=83906 RepID=A0A172J228_BOENI|nr:small auxin up regulated protein [Boehmeria nivea]